MILARENCANSLIDFCGQLFDDFVTAAHHRIIADTIDDALNGKIPPYVLISAPPRHGKSHIVSRALPIYFLGKYPGKEVVWATYNSDLAADFGREVREMIAAERAQTVFPGLTLRADSKAANRFHTPAGGAYYAVGVGSTLTGRGGDLLILDDPFKDWAECQSETTRRRKWSWYTSVFLTRAKRPGGESPPVRIVMSTRWHGDDITGRILAAAEKGGEEVHVVNLPAILWKDSSREQALWPEWFPMRFLKQMQITLGDWMFSALYMQSPKASAGNLIKRKDLDTTRYNTAPLMADMKIYMTLDPAVTDEDEVHEDDPQADPDYTEMAVWGETSSNHLYALDWWYGKVDVLVWIDALFEMYAKCKAITILSEKGVIRRATEPILRSTGRQRGAPLPMQYLLADKSKQVRMVPFQALTQAHMVHFPANAWGDRVVDQLVEFPAGIHDDAADNCSLIGLHRHKMFAPPQPTPKRKKSEPINTGLRISDLIKQKRKPDGDF